MTSRAWVVLALLGGALPALAETGFEYRSVNVNAAILYDGPSPNANKIYVASRYYPVEVVVKLADWIKVRDPSGTLAWTPARNLGNKRMVIVTTPLADVRSSPADNAPLAYQAEKDVVLELVEPPSSGWAKVRHAAGQTGFVRLNQVWGL